MNVKSTGDASSLHEKDKDDSRNAFADILRETTADVLQKKIQEIREDVLEYVNKRIDDMTSDVLQMIKIPSVTNNESLYTNKYRDKRQSGKKDTLPQKEFIERNSLFTDLCKIPHIRAVYNIFLVIFIFLLFNTIVSDIMESGTIRIGINTLRIAFAKFSMCIYIWSFMQASTFSIYVGFTLWAHQRLQFLPQSSIQKFWDYSWLSAFILYQILFVFFPIKMMLDENLSIGCRVIIMIEQIRMFAKNHIFVRSAAFRFLSYKPHSETSSPNGPTFSQYLYFWFAPTFVYRDEYPRTKRIRWKVVVRNFLEFGLGIFYLVFIVERFISPVYHVFGTRYLEQKWFVRNIIESSMPSLLCLIIIQYLQHTWLNAWAEMLQFADRLFYKDWWNSTNYRMFFRKWNVTVHDMLYTYVHKDMYDLVVPRNRVLSAVTVFFISAIVHEYVASLAFGFFYPIMLIFYILSVILFFVSKIFEQSFSNVFMWWSISLGCSIMVSLYSIEFFARRNCPPHSNYYLDLFIPRSWSCQEQFNA